ncbi:hypothetical protein [Marimonas lutisalis]|uniref:hypothetical protein n=1 Tax=Marimonas lutisalis TaxID=2545756 RepID=UPI0010F76578|nr:hypothetical protein [Marimonas lutisalis]
MDKVASLQSHATATAAAPVETTQAVLQAQAGEKSLLRAAPPRSSAPMPPMTAVLLHELRLQQELADVQAKKEEKTG